MAIMFSSNNVVIEKIPASDFGKHKARILSTLQQERRHFTILRIFAILLDRRCSRIVKIPARYDI